MYSNCPVCGKRCGGFENPNCIHMDCAQDFLAFGLWVAKNNRKPDDAITALDYVKEIFNANHS